MSKKILVYSEGLNSWKKLLADPEIHWKTGNSAKTLANDWEENPNLPKEINDVLKNNGLNLELLFAIPEFQVSMPGIGECSHNDVFALLRDQESLSVMMVEGKVSESFDKTIQVWRKNEISENKDLRLKEICKSMELNVDIKNLGEYYYQLFHRTASAIFTAKKYHAKNAIMLVQSYSKNNEKFEDYSNFVTLLNSIIKPEINKIQQIKELKNGIKLYIGWVHGNEKYLEM